MSHTFDIRFARTTGFAALLEAPSNSFRWKGAGRLLVDTHGLTIAFERMLLGFRLRTRRLAVNENTAVYREGEALRFEFASPGAKREVLPIWAHTREAAAEIVRLMPTSRTVELEDGPVLDETFRPDLRLFVLLAALSGIAIVSLLQLRAQSTPAGVPEVPAVSAMPSASQSTTASNDVHREQQDKVAPSSSFPLRDTEEERPTEVLPPAPLDEFADGRPAGADPAIPIPGDTDPGATAARIAAIEAREQVIRDARRRTVDLFLTQSETLRLAYKELVEDADPQELRALEGRWWRLSLDVYEGGIPSSEASRNLELPISQSWRRALYMQASGEYSTAQVNEEIAFATMLTGRLRNSVD